ncbi:hypothetical protein HBN50_00200 [Halobacteriovorax sp. GB3]|uniref:hypothetical protein n=1 Tax=Halobacteriovorax sp. GB3 TaxID=2719615 RepID=UPI00235FF25B|nr:hypothetical protein [Halobacteriovorax sp. GB3]MDD0851487.1 hypothetical protein [Halobacteriovorax sp. GB3]
MSFSKGKLAIPRNLGGTYQVFNWIDTFGAFLSIFLGHSYRRLYGKDFVSRRM